jgi:peptidyl-prolyl cis-trans isomerase A (cyclophilin A)
MLQLRRSVITFGAGVLLVACGGEKKAPATDTTVAPPPTPAATAPATTTPAATPQAPDSFRVVFETSKGKVVAQVRRKWAPNGVDRFYELLKLNYFNDARFFRVVPGFIVQFGMHADPKVNAQWMEKVIPDDSVTHSNKRGTLVFASRMIPNTRSTQFFINLGDNASLDSRGFAPFAEVVEGMDVVDKINPQYGESPDQGMIANKGNDYLKQFFPKLDYIKTATIVGGGAAATAAKDSAKK